MSNLIDYTHIKDSITTRQAAESFGIPVNSHGMALCPFHDDHTPSLKVDENFYCFGCGAGGDVITFTARLLGISNSSAAQKLVRDFGLRAQDLCEYSPIPKSQARKTYENWCRFALETLRHYNQLLFEWKSFAPKEPGGDFHFLFAEAMKRDARVKHLLCTLNFGTEEEKQALYRTCREEVMRIHEQLRTYDPGEDPETAEAG